MFCFICMKDTEFPPHSFHSYSDEIPQNANCIANVLSVDLNQMEILEFCDMHKGEYT